ncbi:MAG: hypothetical protein JWO30_3597 [Fibrobacteres bacterium]|nr:hypothetical protein [Fibrobacterota bacterium]
MREVNVTQLNKELLDDLIWLQKIPGCTNLGRYQGIKDRLEEIERNYDASTNRLTADAAEKDLLLSSLEAYELHDVIQFLRKQPSHSLPIKSLQRLLNGPEYHLDEEPKFGGSEGRDIQFELSLGSRIADSGLQVIDYDDVVVNVDGIKVGFQCKRPAYLKTLKQAFEKAVSQLESRISSGRNDYGFVAICLDKVCELDKVLFRGEDHEQVTERLILERNKISHFLRANRKLASSKRIIGVILNIKGLFFNQKIGRFSPVSAIFTERTEQEGPAGEFDRLFSLIATQMKTGSPD